MAYATVTEVLVRMGHSGATSSDLDARISDALDAATVAIDNDTGRTFTSAIETRTFIAPTGCGDLWVPDLISVSALALDSAGDGTYSTVVPAADYELLTYNFGWPYEIVRLHAGSWPYGGRRSTVQIAGTWGWPEVPAPINQAATLLALRIAQRPSAALFGVQSFGDGGAGYVRNEDPDYVHLVAPYRVIRIA